MKLSLLNKFLFSLFFIVFSNVIYAQTSVWKISKGEDYLYIGGTVHMLPESAFPLPPQFDAAYSNSDTIVLEADIPEEGDTSFEAKLMQAMIYSDGRTLSSVLSEQTYLQLKNYFTRHGMQIEMLDGFKPGFISMQMLAIESIKAQIAGEGVDKFFEKKAKADGKALVFLESVESQIDLIANMGDGHEDAFIKANLAQFEDFKAYFSDMVAGWRSGNMDKLSSLIVEPMQEFDLKLYDELLVMRNIAWLPKIEQMFTDKNKEFVLVGVGHLAGDDSVLALLEKAGYKVEQLP